jgi:hypothetical protein
MSIAGACSPATAGLRDGKSVAARAPLMTTSLAECAMLRIAFSPEERLEP